MNQKPKIIYILVILWIIIGVLFIGTAISRTLSTLDSLDIMGKSAPDKFTASIIFSYVSYTILLIIIIILSFLLAYESYIKKDLFWLIGLMLSSFLITFVINAINIIGAGIIAENLFQMFNSFEYIAYILLIFLVPCQIFLLTRPEVKVYFGKSVVQTKEREIRTFDKTITKTIECPSCGETQKIQGVLGESVEVTCKKCNKKGFHQFR